MNSRNFYAFMLVLILAGIQLTGCGSNGTALSISGSLPATGTVGTAYSGTLMAVGGSNSYTWTVTGLPAGVSASGTSSSTLTISGTPTTAGSSSVSIGLRDAKGRTAASSATIVISAATTNVTISGTLAATGTVGTAYSGSLTASGGTGTYTWNVTGLPTGVTATNTGTATVTISGTPSAAGTSAVTATVKDTATGTATYSVSIVISAAANLTISGTLPATGTTGAEYTGTLTATGGTGPYQWSVTNLPTGVGTSSQTAAALTISGTPSAAGTFAFVAHVLDMSSNASATYNLHIVITNSATVVISGTVPATGTVGTEYTGTLTASGGTPPYQWSVTNLPAGVGTSDQSKPALTISGPPTTAATYAFVAKVTDSVGGTTSYNLHIVIGPNSGGASFTITPGSLGTLTSGTAITPIAVTSSPAGTAPYTWTVASGALPTGLVLDNGTTTNATTITSTTNTINISGTPTASGPYSYTLAVTDSAAVQGSGTVAVSGTVTAAGTTACSTTPAPRGNESAFNLPYAFVLSGTNESGPVAYAGSITPDGTGKLTAGSLDYILNGVPSPVNVDLTNSVYTYGSDGRGCLVVDYTINNTRTTAPALHNALPTPKLQTRRFAKANAAQAIPQTGSIVFSFALSSPYQTGRIQEFDANTTSTAAAGQMHQQTPADFSLAALKPFFVLGVAGSSSNGDGTYSRAAMAASFGQTSGVVTSPAADFDIDGEPSGELSGGSGSLGAQVDATSGRGTGNYTANTLVGPITFDFVYYVINSSDMFLITSDDPAAIGDLALTGRALAAATTSKDLSGYYLAGISGFDANNSGNTVSIGTFQVPSAGSIANANLYTNDAGTYTHNTYAAATYALDTSTARVAISSLGADSPVVYLTDTAPDDQIAGFIVGTDPFGSSGFLLLQSTAVPAFNTASLAGPYNFGSSGDYSGSNGSMVGAFTFTSGNFTETVDAVSGATLLPDEPATGTVSLSAVGDGSGSFGNGGPAIVTNGTVILGVDQTNAPQPLLYIWVSQTLPK